MKLSNIATITTGYCQRKNTGKMLQEVSLVQARDFDSDFVCLAKTNIPAKYSSFLQDNDILVKARGTKHDARLFKMRSRKPVVASNTLLVIRVTDDNFLPGYIAQLINAASVQKYLRVSSLGALLSALSPATLAEIEVEKIPLAKQQQLCDAIEAIEEYKAALERYRNLEDSLLNSLTSRLTKGATKWH